MSEQIPFWAQRLELMGAGEFVGRPPFARGDIVRHPDGRAVKIVGGAYYGTHGVSNFWNWVPVDASGEQTGPKECGYGWTPSAFGPVAK